MHDTDSEWGDADSALVSYFDVLMGDPHTERTGDVDFYVRQASERGGPVLELGCGTGRVLLPIARANVEIDGVDGSSGMLAVLKAKLEHLGRPGNLGRLYRCSMECFTLDRRYNVIICPYIGFQYLLEIGDQLACLRSVRGHLNNDGVFIFDVYDPDVSRLAKSSAGSGSLGPRQVVRLDRDRIVLRDEEISTDCVRQLVTHRYRFTETVGGTVHRSVTVVSRVRYFFRFELIHLLARSGLKVCECYGDFRGAPIGSGGRLVVVACRAE